MSFHGYTVLEGNHHHLRDPATFLMSNINSWRKLCCHVGSAVFDQLSPGKTFTSCRFRSTLLSMCPEAGPYDIAIIYGQQSDDDIKDCSGSFQKVDSKKVDF